MPWNRMGPFINNLDKRNASVTDSSVSDTYRLLSGMSMLLQSCDSEKKLFEIVSLYLPKLFPGTTACHIFIQNRDKKTIEPVMTYPENMLPDAPPELSDCISFIKGVVVGEDSTPQGRCGTCPWKGCCIPICQGDRSIGILCLGDGSAEAASPYRGQAFILAEYLALSISNLRLRQKLHDLTIEDPLTGLNNRRHLNRIFPNEILRAQRHSSRLGVIVADLDHFKQINDTFGHDAGDLVLKETASVLTRVFRRTDVVCRIGGEEFFILMTDGTPEDYINRAQDVRQRIRNLDIRWENKAVQPVSASFGVAVFPDHGTTFESLYKAADQALFSAKKQGRNRVVVAAPARNNES